MKKFIIPLIFACVALGCEQIDTDKKLALNSTEIKISALEEHLITSNGTNVKFSSDNPFVASVNETTGLVAGKHIGETFITATADQGVAKLRVEVVPKYNVINDPYIKWNCSKEELKNKLGSPTQENGNNIIYTQTLAAHALTGYSFTNGKLSNITVALNPDYQTSAAAHLAERYEYWGTQNGAYVFTDSLTEKYTTSVALMKVDGIWCAIYAPSK